MNAKRCRCGMHVFDENKTVPEVFHWLCPKCPPKEARTKHVDVTEKAIRANWRQHRDEVAADAAEKTMAMGGIFIGMGRDLQRDMMTEPEPVELPLEMWVNCSRCNYTTAIRVCEYEILVSLADFNNRNLWYAEQKELEIKGNSPFAKAKALAAEFDRDPHRFDVGQKLNMTLDMAADDLAPEGSY